MRAEFAERHSPAYRRAVIQHVQVTVLKFSDSLSVWPDDVRVSDIPLFRHDPIEDFRARGDFVNFERYPFANERQGLADSVACDASADRIELGREVVQIFADVGDI